MGYIYKISNDINNKVYIGLTTYKDAFKRWEKHLSEYKIATSFSKRPLYEAMSKYGAEHFHFEVIEEVSNDCLSDKESYWISQYRSYIGFENSQGYNATLGGDSGHCTITEKDEKYVVFLYQCGYSCNNIVSLTSHNVTTISNILRAYGFNVHQNKNKVYQLDIKTDAILNIFESQIEANHFLGKRDNDGHIGEVCKGLRKTAYGYKWKYHVDIQSD